MADREGTTATSSADAGPRPPGRKSEQTRQRILEAAAHLFRERGYAHTRISDIAKAAGMHAGALYYYFDSREDMVEQVMLLSTTRIITTVEAALAVLPAGASYREKITAAIAAHLFHVLSRDPFTGAFARVHTQVSPELRERYISHVRDYGRLWNGLLIGARDAGELRDDLDLDVMRLTLLGSLNWILEWFREGRSTPEELAEQVSRTFFEGNGPRV